jgi:uncharacterized protein YjbJ (UPF0337 family)
VAVSGFEDVSGGKVELAMVSPKNVVPEECVMSDPERPEEVAGGVLGRVVGKAKSAVGSLVGNEDLQREGNLQQAHVEAEADAERERAAAELRAQEAAVVEQRVEAAAERDRLRAEVDAEEREDRIREAASERGREIQAAAAREQVAIGARERSQQRTADLVEEETLRQRAEDAAEAARLERQADDAERTAAMIDPEAK